MGKVQKFIKLLSQENRFACEHCLVVSYQVWNFSTNGEKNV